MTLTEYLQRDEAKRGELQRLAERSGLNYSTVWQMARRGHRLRDYPKAQALSRATGGLVPVEQLLVQEPSTGTEG